MTPIRTPSFTPFSTHHTTTSPPHHHLHAPLINTTLHITTSLHHYTTPPPHHTTPPPHHTTATPHHTTPLHHYITTPLHHYITTPHASYRGDEVEIALALKLPQEGQKFTDQSTGAVRQNYMAMHDLPPIRLLCLYMHTRARTRRLTYMPHSSPTHTSIRYSTT